MHRFIPNIGVEHLVKTNNIIMFLSIPHPQPESFPDPSLILQVCHCGEIGNIMKFHIESGIPGYWSTCQIDRVLKQQNPMTRLIVGMC